MGIDRETPNTRNSLDYAHLVTRGMTYRLSWVTTIDQDAIYRKCVPTKVVSIDLRLFTDHLLVSFQFMNLASSFYKLHSNTKRQSR